MENSQYNGCKFQSFLLQDCLVDRFLPDIADMPQATLKFSATVTWAGVPVQRCTVHKERNPLAHAPTALHEEIKADDSDMMYAKTASERIAKHKAFLKKWRLRCRGVANSLEEAGDRLFTFLRYPPEPMEVIAHHQRDRAPARGVQAPGQDPMRPAHSRDGLHVVLGLAGVPES